MFRLAGLFVSKAPSIDDHISIVDIHLNMLVKLAKCECPNTCYQPIFLPRDLKESGVSDELNSLLIGAWNLLWGEPYESSLHRTRGAPPQLEEGVAQINSHAVDLSELMQHMRKGRYSLVAYEQKEGRQTKEIGFDWNPDIRSAISIGDQGPGLFEISPVDSASDYTSTPRISLQVFLCSADEYPVVSGLFQRVQALSGRWSDGATPETIHSFLRAYLVEASKMNNNEMKKP